MRFLRHVSLLLLAIGTCHVSTAELALEPGEQLAFRVSWGIFFNAGSIEISTRDESTTARSTMVVSTKTATRGVVRRLLRFEAMADSVYDVESGRMLIHTEQSLSSRKKANFALELNYEKRLARFTDFVNPDRTQDVPMPEGLVNDLIMSLIQTRSWDMKPGDKRDINVAFEKDIYELTVYALRYETVETPLGKFRTLVFQPRMEKTPPKGMFKRGSTVQVWIAQDDPRKLPVKFEVEFKFGAGVATLVKHTPAGASATATAATDASAEETENETALD
ncbi:MAG: DUF3108 domain-containing protein [Opitutus sp.]|nr:DUF3108 domain-containing protein [Opitutus sp.]